MEFRGNSTGNVRIPDARHRAIFLTRFLLIITVLTLSLLANGESQNATHVFAVQDGQFVLDGKPFRIISGEMHYPRIPRAYWRERFRMAKAMGLNTITTYVFWNVHEPSPGVYDFSGNNDVAEYIREAQQEGLYVILRPGPYVCAEWEFGGYPAWLLKDHSLVARTKDPKYVAIADRWIKRLGEELAPLQIGNGGPIILVQLENEYGSFGNDRAYLEQLKQSLLNAGFTKAQLYTADPPEALSKGSLPELPAGINFNAGIGNGAESSFSVLKQLRPNGPFISSEFWDGWFDHWGTAHAYTDGARQAANLQWVLTHGYSVSLYMFHGGTDFGWMNGANFNDKKYEPDVTSYDYDAPLDESGHPTAKYYVLRDVIAKATGVTPPPVPAIAPVISIAEFKLDEGISLWKTLPAPIHSEQPLSMEDIDEAYGYILYRTQVKGPVKGDLDLEELHDYAQVYLDGKLVGILDRRLGQSHLQLDVNGPSEQLDILVENSGRVNYPFDPRSERQGITEKATLNGVRVVGWEIYPLPMLQTSELPFSPADCEGACFYRGTFNVDSPGDTFLDTSAFSKGEVWVNGYALGRIWKIGPQKTLYLPAPWLHKGKNSVIIFDLNGEPGRSLVGREKPILGSNEQWLYSRFLLHRRLSILTAGLLVLFATLLIGWLALNRGTRKFPDLHDRKL